MGRVSRPWIPIVLMLALGRAAWAGAPGCHAEPVQPVAKDEYARLQKALLGKAEPDMDTPFRFFVADIDNDGRPEIVGETSMGSGGYLGLTIYDEKKGKLVERGAPPNLEGSGHADEHFLNAAQATPELLIRLCGRTYLALVGNEEGAIEGYLWKGGRTVRACDADWTAFQRARFKASYDGGLYDIAEHTLSGYLRVCGDALPNEARLAILSDMAVTSFHLGDYASCLGSVKEARQVPGFARSRSKKALVFNEAQCAHPAVEKKTNDFHWLLDDKARSATVEKQLDEVLLAATVPDVDFESAKLDRRAQSWLKIPGGARIPGAVAVARSRAKLDLRGLVRDSLWASDDVQQPVVQDRYVTRTGWVPHSAENRAMLWVDVAAGTSVFVVNDFHDCFLAGSRSLGSAELPPEFKAAFARWRAAIPLKHSCAYFVDGRKPVPDVSALDLGR
jgi:hypothetical protein